MVAFIQLVDAASRLIATAEVADAGGRYEGSIDLSVMPDPVLQVFTEFEEIVNGQMLSFLDAIERRIRSLAIRVRFGEGPAIPVENLQIFPRQRLISFNLLERLTNGSSPLPSPGSSLQTT